MKSYGEYCPIAKGSEVLGERWSMLVMRELLIGSHRFNDIARGLPDMSRTLLTKRLRQFEQIGIVERVGTAYHLTAAGEGLRPIVFGLGDWTARWLLADPEPEELDSERAMWWGHSRIDTSSLPAKRVVIAFVFSDDRRMYWLVVEPDVGVSICLSDPGFEVDVTVRTDVATLSTLWQGRGSVQAAVRAGRMAFEGTRALTRRMPEVLTIAHPSVMGTSESAPRPRIFAA